MTSSFAHRRLLRGNRPRRVLVWVLASFVAVNVLLAVFARVWKSYDPVFYRERLAVCQAGSWDLVVAGGSPVMSGVDVERLEGLNWKGRPLTRGFNLGLPMATTSEISLAVEHGVGKAPPRLLVYGIAATDLNGSRAEAVGPRYLMDLSDALRWARRRPRSGVKTVKQVLQERAIQACPLAVHGDGLQLWTADLLRSLSPEGAVQARQKLQESAALRERVGHLPRGVVQPTSRLPYRKTHGEAEPPAAFFQNYNVNGYLPELRRMLKWARREGVDVVLVAMPFAADVERAFPREFADFRAVLAQVRRDHGVRILQPTRAEVGLTDAEFNDYYHFNADGVARFSDWLRRALAALPEH